MKTQLFNLLLLVLLINIFIGDCYERFSLRSRPNCFRKLRKKLKDYRNGYITSYKLSGEDIAGEYTLKANFLLKKQLVPVLSWQLFYLLHRKSMNPFEYYKLKKEYQRVKNSIYDSKYDLNKIKIAKKCFIESHNINTYTVSLGCNNRVYMDEKLSDMNDLVNQGIRSVGNLLCTLNTNSEDFFRGAYWKLSFNYLFGYNTLIIKAPGQIASVPYTMTFKIRDRFRCKL